MYLLLLFLVGAVFGLAILGMIFNNKLTKELKNNLPPELQNMGGGRIGFGEELDNLPSDIRTIIIHSFVSSFNLSFIVVIAMGALTLISALFMENIKPKHRFDEKDVIVVCL